MAESEAAYVIMHPLQWRACGEVMPVYDIAKELKPDELSPQKFTGVQLILDGHFPPDVIEYRNAQHDVILRIKNLAHPEIKVTVDDQRIGHQG